jgi:hypothetical protein
MRLRPLVSNPVPMPSPPSCGARPRRPAAVESPYAWLRLAVSLLLMTIGGSGMYAVTVVLPPSRQEFGVARGDASLPYTLTMIGFGLGGIAMGRLADRFGVMLPVLVGGVGLGAGFICAGWRRACGRSAWRRGCCSGSWAPPPPSPRWCRTPRCGSTAAAASRWRSA